MLSEKALFAGLKRWIQVIMALALTGAPVGLIGCGAEELSDEPQLLEAELDFMPGQDQGGMGYEWDEAPWRSGTCLHVTQGHKGVSHTSLPGCPVDLDDGCYEPGHTLFFCPFPECRVHTPCRKTTSGWGKNVCLEDTRDGRWFFLGHLAFTADGIANGVTVKRGASIGAMGNTGNVLGTMGCAGAGTHLHFEYGSAGSQIGRLSSEPPWPIRVGNSICSTTPSNERTCTPNATRCSAGILYTCDGSGLKESAQMCLRRECADDRNCKAESPMGPCSGGEMPRVTWLPRAPLPMAEPLIIAAVLDDKLHVFGGQSYLRHRIFDPQRNSWEEKKELAYSLNEGGAASVNGVLYGFGEGLFGSKYAMRWNADNDTWTNLAENPWPRRLPAVGVIGGKVYLAGGFSSNDTKVNSYDPVANSWRTMRDLPSKLGVPSSIVYNGRLYVFGKNVDTVEAQVYDPAIDTWASLPTLAQWRYGARALLRGSTVWLLGGSNNNVPQDSIFFYEIETKMWCEGPKLPQSMLLFVVEQIRGRIYLLGGSNTAVWEGTIN